MPSFNFLDIAVITGVIAVITGLVCLLPWAIADLVNAVRKHL